MVDGEAECTSTAPDGCTPEPADFKCTSEGFFPDALDCHRYYHCHEDDTGIMAEAHECPGTTYVFDPSGPNNKFCRLTNGNRAYCSEVKCTEGKTFENIIMRFSWYPASLGQYVVSCIGGKAGFITRCPAGLTPNIKSIKPKCELACTRAAVAAHPTDATKYYECIYNAVTRIWERKDQTCYTGWLFDEKLKTCVQAPKCTNGANNPPKCNACSGNKFFTDGSCTDCAKQILNAAKTACEDCPDKGTEYNTALKKCACVVPGAVFVAEKNDCACPVNAVLTGGSCVDCVKQIANTAQTVCEACVPAEAEYNKDLKKCACPGNKALKDGACVDCGIPGPNEDKSACKT